MALSEQNKNLISELEEASLRTLTLRDVWEDLIARWSLNGVFDALNDADIQVIFPHLTKSEVSNSITAGTAAFITALGDDSSGQASNLRKMKG